MFYIIKSKKVPLLHFLYVLKKQAIFYRIYFSIACIIRISGEIFGWKQISSGRYPIIEQEETTPGTESCFIEYSYKNTCVVVFNTIIKANLIGVSKQKNFACYI